MKRSPSDIRRAQRRWLARNGHALACTLASHAGKAHEPLHPARSAMYARCKLSGHPMRQ
jgi:hypothetical protein